MVTWAEKPLKVPHVDCPSQDEPPLNVQERTNFKPNVPPAHLSWIYRVSRILHGEKALSESTPLLVLGQTPSMANHRPQSQLVFSIIHGYLFSLALPPKFCTRVLLKPTSPASSPENGSLYLKLV